MRILILDDIHPEFVSIMNEMGCISTILPHLKREEMMEMLPQFEGLIVNSKTKVDVELIDSGERLRFIGRPGSGMENIDVHYATKKNVTCFNSPEGNCDAVAEHLIGMLLMLANKLGKAHSEMKQKVALRAENRGWELNEKTIGIIGFGNVGNSLAHKLQGFDCRIMAYDKYKKNFGTGAVEECSLEKIYEQADIVSLHVPLTHETLFMADHRFFEACQKEIVFINTARGKLLKTSALIEALKTGKVKGACLDVLENEELNNLTVEEQEYFEYLTKHPEVILTPHIAGWTFESKRKMATVLASKLVNFFYSH